MTNKAVRSGRRALPYLRLGWNSIESMIFANPVAAIEDYRATQLSVEAEIAVGRIAVWSSQLERDLGKLVQNLSATAKVEPPSPGSKAIRDARRLIQASAALSDDETTEILQRLDDSGKLLKKRNIVMHAVVGTSRTPGAATFRTHPKNEDLILTAENLEEIAEQLHRTAWLVFDCSMMVAAAFGRHENKQR